MEVVEVDVGGLRIRVEAGQGRACLVCMCCALAPCRRTQFPRRAGHSGAPSCSTSCRYSKLRSTASRQCWGEPSTTNWPLGSM